MCFSSEQDVSGLSSAHEGGEAAVIATRALASFALQTMAKSHLMPRLGLPNLHEGLPLQG